VPRYLFHVCNGTGFVADEEGVELEDDSAALDLAMRSAQELMSEDIGRGVLDFASFIEVECEGRHVRTLTFKDVVQVKGL
jgi:hypothetical protein